MAKKIDDFRKLLESVPKSYEDFVESGVELGTEDSSYIDKITDFIKSNPEATSSDVVQFETEEIFGIKPLI